LGLGLVLVQIVILVQVEVEALFSPMRAYERTEETVKVEHSGAGIGSRVGATSSTRVALRYGYRYGTWKWMFYFILFYFVFFSFLKQCCSNMPGFAVHIYRYSHPSTAHPQCPSIHPCCTAGNSVTRLASINEVTSARMGDVLDLQILAAKELQVNDDHPHSPRCSGAADPPAEAG
jgi:hypothetical protein